jgi:hypothetical protein
MSRWKIDIAILESRHDKNVRGGKGESLEDYSKESEIEAK